MAIEEKITQVDDLYLYEIFRNPVLFGEFIANYDKLPGEEPFEFSYYQVEWFCDFSSYMSLCCGRAVGKTLYLTYYILWLLVNDIFGGEYITYHVPGRNHLEPVFTQLVKQLRTNTLLKQFIAPNAGINQSDYKISLLNQASLLCRIAGQSGTGISVVGLHSPVVIVDESGYYPWGTWNELQPTVNTFTPGFRLVASGVPDGRREKSVCFHCDQENSSFSRHMISALDNPRFTERDRLKAVEQYGGEDSEDYIHMVLGQHGRPVFTLFDRSQMQIGNDPVYPITLNGLNIGNDLSEYMHKLSVIPRIPDGTQAIIGVDLGYTEPSAIIIMYLDTHKRMHFHARISLEKVAYPIQEKLIDWLDTRFRPGLIGMDEGAGGQGISVIQHLRGDEDYAHKKYDVRLQPVNFSSWIVLGIDQDGKEIKSRAKPYAVSILQDYCNNHRIIFSSTDMEMITELERMTYIKNPNGDIAYRTLTMRGGMRGADHFTGALLCLAISYYLQNEFITQNPKQKKLLKANWVM